jgi:hypothetical protein
MAQKASPAQQTASPNAPRASLRLTRGVGAAPRNTRIARGLDSPSGEFPPRSRDPAPRSAPLEGSSPSREAPPHLRPPVDLQHHTCFPDRSIKCSDASRVPGSKANPRHADPLTPPGNQIPTLFDQPALCSHPRCCVGRPVSFRDTVPPTPVPPPRRAPRKRKTAPSKGVHPPTPHPPRMMS